MEDIANGSLPNLDQATVDHFGEEWSSFTQDQGWGQAGLAKSMGEYFAALPEGLLTADAVVGDFGAGSGRWASQVAPLVHHLFVIEPSSGAMSVARSNLAGATNVTFVEEPIGGPKMAIGQLDIAYSLGVIHHIPDSTQALRDVRTSLKPGGYFLGYLYYALENRPRWYRALWRASDTARSRVSRMPTYRKRTVTDATAALLYWPAARLTRVLTSLGVPVTHIPLNQYADKTFYVMRNDALDRLGTPLEQRFTRSQIKDMLGRAGYDVSTLTFSDGEPFWCFSVQNPIHG